ncbi:hypothetical protein PWT90_07595 [Aphanocladium album]|nr:hypothetical protein PWT90_07595 [Aphanocladium album]
MGSLNGIRAVVNYSAKLGLKDNPMVLNVKGWFMGGTPINFTSIWLKVDNTVFSGFEPSAMAGLSKPTAYGTKLQPLIDSVFTSYVNLVKFAGKSLFDTTVQSMGKDFLNQLDLAVVLTDTTIGLNTEERPQPPVLMYHTTQDEVIPYAGAVVLHKTWCDTGVGIHFTNYDAGGHMTT